MHPSNGFVQAQLLRAEDSKNGKDDRWAVEGDVSRIDVYGNQSICIKDEILRKYCYCRVQSRSV